MSGVCKTCETETPTAKALIDDQCFSCWNNLEKATCIHCEEVLGRIDTNSKLVCVDCLADIFRAGRGLHTKTKRERMLGKRQKE